MKRSEINGLIESSLAFFGRMGFRLPRWGTWGPRDWQDNRGQVGRIAERMLGWDLTDFGSGRFRERGLILFTIRNGLPDPAKREKPYAEKIMIVEEDQETPWHFHWSKSEDIINRGGGNLVIELNGSTPEEDFAPGPVTALIDEIPRTLPAGGRVVLAPGESICLLQRTYHRFYGEEGRGRVLVGEVSAVNDDTKDNRFHEPVGRFPAIEEDEPPRWLLVTDYPRWLR